MAIGERMSPVDRAWLLMERPTNPMVIVGVIVLAGRLQRTRLRQLIEQRLLVFDRFRCRPESAALAAQWVRTRDFDVDDHVLTAALPAPAGQQELEALVGELSGTPFNASRPWWSFHLVEHYDGRGSAIIARIHHCYADGIALMRVLLGLADGAGVPKHRPSGATAPAHDPTLFDTLYEPLAGLVTNAWQAGTQLVQQGTRYALHPLDTAAIAADATGAIAELRKRL
jgi:WS/DGAT/MGAT family acyltransferase